MDLSFDDADTRDSATGLAENGISPLHNAENLSISGAQEKIPAILENGKIRIAKAGERSTYILKPAPLDRIYLREQIPANDILRCR